MAEPVKGVSYEFYVSLADAGDPTQFKSNPTLASGDFQLSKDGGSFSNLATLPVVAPSSSASVKIVLSATEMTADKVVVKAIDVAGSEWNQLIVFIDVPVSSSETAVDILEGDHDESRTNVTIFKKGTSTKLIEKDITVSLLTEGVVIQTRDT